MKAETIENWIGNNNWIKKNLYAFNSWHKKREKEKEKREQERKEQESLDIIEIIIIFLIILFIGIPTILFGWILRILRIEKSED